MIIMASASSPLVPAIARVVAADEDTVRGVIHAFNEKSLAALDPRRAGGRPRLIGDGGIEVMVAAARTRPEKLGLPFTRWSLRKLAGYLAGRDDPVRIGRERLRPVLHARGISFQRTRTWKEMPRSGPGRQAGPDRVRDQQLPGPVRCLRPVRAVIDTALPRHLPGAAQTSGPTARDLPSHPRHPLLPR